MIYANSASVPIGATHHLILGENFPANVSKVVCYSRRKQMPCSLSDMNERNAVLKFDSPITDEFEGAMYVSLDLGTHWSTEVQVGIVRLSAEHNQVVVIEVFGIVMVVLVIVGANVCWKLWDIGFYGESVDDLESDDVLSVTRELFENSS